MGGRRDDRGREARLGLGRFAQQLLDPGLDARDVFPSPWTDWVVQITPKAYRVSNKKNDTSFVVRPSGDWLYVAWEAPRTSLSVGRLWVSDADGLRAFVP